MLAAVLIASGCGETNELRIQMIPTGTPAPLSLLSANALCADCADAVAERPAWFAKLAAECDPDVVLVQGLASRADFEALDGALPSHEGFYIGVDGISPFIARS